MLTTNQIEVIAKINPIQLTMSLIVQRCNQVNIKPPTRSDVCEAVIAGVFDDAHMREFATWLTPTELATARQATTNQKLIQLLVGLTQVVEVLIPAIHDLQGMVGGVRELLIKHNDWLRAIDAAPTPTATATPTAEATATPAPPPPAPKPPKS